MPGCSLVAPLADIPVPRVLTANTSPGLKGVWSSVMGKGAEGGREGFAREKKKNDFFSSAVK